MAVQFVLRTTSFSAKTLAKYMSNGFNFCNVNRPYCSQNHSEHVEPPWDIVISGGGMVGCAMACALGNSGVLSGKRILLLESSLKTDYVVDPDKYSNRVCAISPGSRTLFQRLGAWEKIPRFKEVKKMQVWESCSDARIVFQHPDMVNDIAYIIENDAILKALNERLYDLKENVQIMRGAIAVQYTLPSAGNIENDKVAIKLKDGQVLHTKLLIGADGVNSAVRQTMGVKYIKWNYNQKGIVATLKLSEPTSNVVAWQRFLPAGPIALLPLTDESCSLVWTVSNSMAEKLRTLSDDDFVDALNSSLWDDKYKNTFVESAVSRLKDVLHTLAPVRESVQQLPPSILSVEPNSRAEFPLGLGHATQYVASRVAIIGDAAHRVHPLAGQGVNLGFGDVQCLTDCLETSVFNGNDIGHIEPLLDYEVQRQRHVVPSMAAIDALNKLYKIQFTPIVLLRSLGVTMFDSSDWIKSRLIKHASA